MRDCTDWGVGSDQLCRKLWLGHLKSTLTERGQLSQTDMPTRSGIKSQRYPKELPPSSSAGWFLQGLAGYCLGLNFLPVSHCQGESPYLLRVGVSSLIWAMTVASFLCPCINPVLSKFLLETITDSSAFYLRVFVTCHGYTYFCEITKLWFDFVDV